MTAERFAERAAQVTADPPMTKHEKFAYKAKGIYVLPTPNGALHKHDCDKCVYVGSRISSLDKVNPAQVDIYYCPEQPGEPTFIVRFGPDGDYITGWPTATCSGIVGWRGGHPAADDSSSMIVHDVLWAAVSMMRDHGKRVPFGNVAARD